MNKIISLLKASMTDGMNIFKIYTKKKNTFTKIILPIILTLIIMGYMFSYSKIIIEQLATVKMEYVLLSLFVIVTSLMTLIEGIYKSGNLLFNCKDDDLLFSLPIKKSTVLFIRVFKFYIFELIFNSIFIIPAMIVYGIYVHPSVIYYLVSIIGVFLFPIIPILLSCLIGVFITYITSKFKVRNMIRTLLTIVFIIGIIAFSYNIDSFMVNISKNAVSINDYITKMYYPAKAYIQLVNNFNIIKLLEFVVMHILLFILCIMLISKVYFNINSGIKAIKVGKAKKEYKIKTSSKTMAIVKKEFSRFITSTVFVTNAGFGLILYIIACVFFSIKYNSIVASFENTFSEYIKNYIPTLLFVFICFTSFMTSITSSMISLEGKSFSILKSLPMKAYEIVKAKVLAAIFIMIPCILIGDLIIFVRFRFNILNILLILIVSILLPLVSETIGIIINLKYPKMNATNDTEIVKQSLSSNIAVFIGMGMSGITVFLLFNAIEYGLSNNNIMLLFLSAYAIIYAGLLLILRKISEKCFDNITI